MSDIAPIIIFCYRRKINRLIESLLKNKESSISNLYIFSDGYKSDLDKQDVFDLRKSIKEIKGFKSISVFDSKKNKGLAGSIIDGITSVINKYGKIIIIEDDIIVSEYFLDFMNKSLNFYKNNKNIWSISGYCPILECLKNYKKEVFLSLRSSSWGWASWSDRWNKSRWSMEDFQNFKNNNDKIKILNQGGNDLFKMLELQYLGKIDSWAIRWQYSQFLNSAYSVTPKISMTQNIGFNDKFSTHTKGKNLKWKVKLAKIKITNFEFEMNTEIIEALKNYYDLSLYTKIGYFLKKWGGYKTIKKYYK